MPNIRLGAVSYLNTRPLVYGLDRHADRFLVRFDVPSVCSALLHAGEVDVGLVPSIEYAAGDYRLVPGIAIASFGDVASVALFSPRPIDRILSIALDRSSRTSIALLRVLCADRFHIAPSFNTFAPDIEAMLARADAALVIGDLALFLDHERLGLHKTDLGAEWTAMTGLPFVYACWTGRPGVLTAADVAGLQDARADGEAHIEAIARAEAPGDAARVAVIAKYLRDNIRYDLGEAEEAGLRRFYERAAALGLIPHAPAVRFY
jgi:chorismate dehydratase